MRWIQKKINTIWLEIDYELLTLHEAQTTSERIKSKEHLERLTKDLKKWECILNDYE